MTTPHLEDLARGIEQLIHAHLAACQRQAHAAMTRAFAAHAPTGSLDLRRSHTAPARQRGVEHKRRTAQELRLLSEKAYAAVCAAPGESMAVLADRLGVDAAALSLPMQKLRATGRVRHVGARHLTRYFPVAVSPR